MQEFTYEAYMCGLEPYEYIYSLKDNPVRQKQELERLAIQARQVGVKSFKGIYSAYLQKLRASKENPDAKVTEFDGQPLTLECGEYDCTDLGIATRNDYGYEELVCSHPILPVRRLVNIDSGEVKLEIAYKRGRTWRSAIFDKTTLSSAQKIIGLSAWGIGVDSENARGMVKYLSALENLNYDEIPEARSVGRLGWVEDYGFSPYVEGLVFDGDDKYRHSFGAVKAHGIYAKWLDLALEARQGSSIVCRTMLAASFAAPLIKLAEALPFVVHAWGGAGAGKTVGLMFAASVWAKPSLGDYAKSFNGTMVANEMHAAFCGSLPLCLDELQCIKDRKGFDDIIYMLCEGVGKARGSKSGGLQKTLTWRNTIISTGEMPITSGNSGGGAVNRVIEMDCKGEKLFRDPRAAVATMAQNYGYAGREFIKALEGEEARERLHEAQKRHYAALSGKVTDKQALAASMLLTADELAERYIFHDGICLTAEELLPFLVTNDQADANKRAYHWLLDMVASNPARFTPAGEDTYVGECWGCVEEDKGRIWIIKSVFDRLMGQEGYSGESFLSWAKRTRMIETSSGRNVKRKRIPGLALPAWCVCLVAQFGEETVDADGFTQVSPEDEQVFMNL